MITISFFSFYLYIFPPDSQNTDRGAMHRASNYPAQLQDRFYTFIEMLLKFRTACQDHQAGESVVKCLSQGHNRMERVGFEPRP